MEPASLSRQSAEIVAQIARFAAPPDDQVAAFIAAGRPRRLRAGETFCALGQEAHELGFLHHGIARYYVILPDGEEATKDFSFAGDNPFIVSFGSAVLGRPAAVAIAAVTECRLTVWPYRLITALHDRHPEWQKFGRCAAEFLYARKERREIAFLLDSAETRYAAMLASFPPELRAVPQHQLASYLGIRPQSLSRLKKRVRRLNLGE